ncbi:stringent starvation protein A [Pseudoruegeria aquimaris]|uniref:Stringent starvation protein A n=1 Tax=Pseudoruegeria aquimaris TaxID=393663 RepID=A0A1Y5SQM3_9RHOB|nr:glutathione S-transferase [Pseudoruegeria aquimaris]SLN45465.1 stringent starvation protein A [Pseudoruegeria aquimaris]
MTYLLALADRAYSSWSLRGWLLFEKFDIPVTCRFGRLYTDAFPAMLADFSPARTVPALRTPTGTVIPDSLAIAEELHSRHPNAGLLPADPARRAVARALMAEMHTGFTALRNACPMNLRVAYGDFEPDDAVQRDLRRLEELWAWALETTGSDGPWLCGDYSAADAFFAPVAARVATYGLKIAPAAQSYVEAHLADTAFRRWRAMGLVDGADQPFYARDFVPVPWPGPAPLPARAVDGGTPENSTCPYSGKPVTHLLELDGRRFGFCNAFCRDKTVADAEAWPAFMNLYHS